MPLAGTDTLAAPGGPRRARRRCPAPSASNLGSSLCPPALGCHVFSCEAKASNNATVLVGPLWTTGTA